MSSHLLTHGVWLTIGKKTEELPDNFLKAGIA